MFEALAQAFVALIVTVDPVGNVPLFLSLTAGADAAHRRKMAIRGPLVATVILAVFALVGHGALHLFGITLPAFRIAGGLLLFALAFEMLFAKRADRREKTADDVASHVEPDDVAVFPLAVPLLAGPGGIASVILLSADGPGPGRWAVLAVIPVVMAVSAGLFMLSGRIERLVSLTVIEAVTRVLGILLAALAIQYVVDGLLAVWPG
jgi:multiple antibiotic resistance protein